MPKMYYVSHPEVVIDPDVPVPDWGLTPTGQARTEAMCNVQPWISTVDRLIVSDERKAIEAGEIVTRQIGITPDVRPDTAEIDRSATGFVPHEEHERLADLLFSRPNESAEGWETASAAQNRVIAALDDVVACEETTMVIGHGGVGTLLWCHFSGETIDRRFDQPHAGCWFAVDLASGRTDGWWRPIDEAP